MKSKIIFFGSDQYSKIVLSELLGKFPVAAVISLPYAEDIKKFSKKKFPVFEWTSIIYIIEVIKKLQPDVGILASFGRILPKRLLQAFPGGVLNIHPSLLPKYRGPAPVPTAILNKEVETGVTIFKMDEKVDHGPIIAQFKEEIRPEENSHDLLSRLFSAGAKVLATILPAYLEGRIKLRRQEEVKATFTKKFAKDDGKIDWSKPDDYLDRFIRAMFPWPGAYTNVELRIKNVKLEKRLKILRAHLENRELVLDQVQLEGKKPVSWKQFCEGYPSARIIRSS